MKHNHKAEAEALRIIGEEEQPMPEQTKPKPCPFCGSEPIIRESHDVSTQTAFQQVCCVSRKCFTIPCSSSATRAGALSAWNTRHEPDPAAHVEAVKLARDVVEGFIEEHEADSLCDDPATCGRTYVPRLGITPVCKRCELIKDARAALAAFPDPATERSPT